MKKKAVIFISLFATVLVGAGVASFALLSDDFSFSNLTVDISQSNALGVGKLNPSAPLNGRRNQVTTSESSEFNKLIKVNENGDVEIIRFYNESESEVQIPFHPILIENYGEFTYIVYSDWSAEYSLDDNSIEIRQLFWRSYGQEAWNRDKLFNYEFVAIHKTTGKVFDLKESIINQHTQSKTLSSTLVYLPDGFAYTTDPSQNNNEVCINRGTFNDSTEVIDVSVVCTDVIAGFENFDSNPTALPNGDIKLSDFNESRNKILNLYTFDIYDLGSLSSDDPRFKYFSVGIGGLYFISDKQFSWFSSLGENRGIISSAFYENSTITLIENTIDIENFSRYDFYLYSNRNLFSSAPFINISYSYLDESLKISINNVDPLTLDFEEIIIFDLLDYEPDINPMDQLYLDYHFYQNSLFLIKSGDKPFIYEVNLLDNTLSKIFSSTGRGYFVQEETKNPNFFLFGEEFYYSNGFTTFKRTGNYYYSEIQSLSERKFKFNIYNKETYEESQSTPTFSYFEITPIN